MARLCCLGYLLDKHHGRTSLGCLLAKDYGTFLPLHPLDVLYPIVNVLALEAKRVTLPRSGIRLLHVQGVKTTGRWSECLPG